MPGRGREWTCYTREWACYTRRGGVPQGALTHSVALHGRNPTSPGPLHRRSGGTPGTTLAPGPWPLAPGPWPLQHRLRGGTRRPLPWPLAPGPWPQHRRGGGTLATRLRALGGAAQRRVQGTAQRRVQGTAQRRGRAVEGAPLDLEGSLWAHGWWRRPAHKAQGWWRPTQSTAKM